MSATQRPAVDELADIEQRLLAESFPRLHMALIVAVAGLCAFFASVLLLYGGVPGMAMRYFVAALVGYGAFIGLIRVWISYQRRQWSLELESDLVDLPSWDGPARGSGSPASPSTDVPVRGGSFGGGGGSFGGGGASGSFGPPISSAGPRSVAGSSKSGILDGVGGADVEGVGPLVILLALAAVIAGLISLGFVVYTSPLLFAEVLLDAAVVGAVYRRARRREKQHWARGVLRRTWLAAAAVCAFAALFGAALQLAAPEARSLGEVLEAREQD